MSLPKRTALLSGLGACLLTGFVAFSANAAAESMNSLRLAQAETSSNVQLAEGHPDRYVVVKGDTLWDISSMFLKDPWLWPEIWYVNPQVENPHLIFPGDILTLVWIDGRPQLQLQRGDVEKLSPQVRVQALDEAITTIPYDAISAFLSRPGVISKSDRDNAPYILTARKGHLIGAAGMDVYVRKSSSPKGTAVSIMHADEALVDPDDGEVLGYQGLYVGQGRVDRTGDPATVHLTETAREALEGDLLFPNDREIPLHFIPRSPSSNVEGRIIAVVDGLSLIGQYMVVVINRGTRHGLEPGHVLAIWQTGEVVRDTVKGKKSFGEKVKLPDEYAGEMMLFDTRERMSYGLVVNAQSEIRKLDTVRNP
jgi:hypothetical protein